MKITLFFIFLYSFLLRDSIQIYYSPSDVVLAMKVDSAYTSSTNILRAEIDIKAIDENGLWNSQYINSELAESEIDNNENDNCLLGSIDKKWYV